MRWLKRLIGKEGAEQETLVVPEPKAPSPPSPSFGDEAVTARSNDGKKVKLNFKKIPKKVVEAIAAETTGQPRTIAMDSQSSDGSDVILFPEGSLSGVFNRAATKAPMPRKPRMMGPKP